MIKNNQNPQKGDLLAKRHITKLKIKEKYSKKNTRASKSNKRFIIQKEQGWNQSFVNAKLSDFTSLSCVYSRSNKDRVGALNHVYIPSGTPRIQQNVKFRIRKSCSPQNLYSFRPVPNHYLVNKKLLTSVSPQKAIQSLNYDLNKLYDLKQVPECHRKLIKSIRNKLKTKQQQIILLKTQLQQIKSPLSCIFGLKIICQARQSCLTSINTLINLVIIDKNKQLTSSSNSNSTSNSNKLKSLKQHINDLRVLSLNCIQKILQWRDVILSYSTSLNAKINPIFSYSEQDKGNYLFKIQYDNKLIFDSNIFKCCSYPDPFMVSLSQEEQLQLDMKQYFKIRASELFILEQSLV